MIQKVRKNSDIAIKKEMQKIVIEFPGYGYRRSKWSFGTEPCS